MLADPFQREMAATVAAMVHREKWQDAAELLADLHEVRKADFSNPAKSLPMLQTYLHHLMDSGGMEEASAMLWTPTQFTPEPQSVRDLWNLFDTADQGLIMGGASMGKSYSVGVRLFLEFVRDPMWTSIKVIGPSEDHLEANLFSHLVSLHNTAKLPMPGEVGELFIGLNRREQLGSIKGIIIPVGKVKKAGRLQGTKRKPRPTPHPLFGPLSRMFIFIDEIENVPGGLWSDIDNVLANVDNDYHGMKIFGAYNPTNQHDEVAKRAEPEFGWSSFDADVHYRWRSKRGWEVLRLDGEKSENVLQGKVVYPGLQTRDGLEVIARNAGGRQASGYFSMGRGAYPPMGAELTIIPMAMVNKSKAEAIWYEVPHPVAGCDVALEGRDTCSYSLGRCGNATGLKLPPTIEFPQGRTVMFKNDRDQVTPQWVVQLDQQFPLPKADTPAMTKQILDVTRRAGVKPEFFAIDRTGIGTGVADLIKNDWSRQVHDVNYSESPSVGQRIMQEDAKPCDEDFQQICSQLWFMMRAYFEFGYLIIVPSVSMDQLEFQLTNRRFRMAGKQRKAESKRDYMSRGAWQSPGEADSLSLMLYAAWKGSGVTPSMKHTPTDRGEGFDDDYYSFRMPGGVYIDSTNRTDSLDERPGMGDSFS